MQHIFMVGAKSIGQYGGYETFVDKLTEYHQNNKKVKYHIACKANGQGYMDERKLEKVIRINDSEFIYHNAHCFKIEVPDVGSVQAIYYDIKALEYCCNYIIKNKIKHPVVYVLSCRIGPFMQKYKKIIYDVGGILYVNPDGHEWKRGKWSAPVRKYWKISERWMVKYADLLVCDSKNIERYINFEYKKYSPKTTFIAYGSDVVPSKLSDDSPEFLEWLKSQNIKSANYYISVGRFVPENNFETMIREFMKSKTDKDFVIIATKDKKFLTSLNKRLQFSKDRRIKFAGTVYNKELLKKIRENAYGYFHGHEVGGTNPSLLESLSATKLNLLYDVEFNKEVAGDAALYWNKREGNLASLIDMSDLMTKKDIENLGQKAKKRIKDAYSWQYIAGKYLEIFL